jgi:SAM-dependent methyltransferase
MSNSNNYPSEEEQKKYYDENVSKRVCNRRLVSIRRYIKYRMCDKKIKNVLEIGCGIGITSKIFSDLGMSVLGIDISEKSIEKCKSNKIDNAEFICDNFVDIDLGDRTFDLIVLFDVLEHIPKPQHITVFEQIKKYSHAKTKIAITIPEPVFLDKVRETNPDVLQPIDESIYSSHIDPIFKLFGLQLIHKIYFRNYVRYFLQYQ